MSSSLLLQQCPSCLVRQTWIVLWWEVGGRIVVALWGVASRNGSILNFKKCLIYQSSYFPKTSSDIVAGVLQGDTLAPYLFIICLDYVLRENGFELTKKRSKRYPAKTITETDYADDLALLPNTPNQAETLLHSLERAAAGIGLHVNAHKTEYMCYNQTGNITTLDGASLRLMDKFTYLGRSVSSTENDNRHTTDESMDGYR